MDKCAKKQVLFRLLRENCALQLYLGLHIYHGDRYVYTK